MTPSELLQGRQIRTRLDLLKPNVNEWVEHRQFQQKLAQGSSTRERGFKKGEAVYGQNFGTGLKWCSGVIQGVTGPVSFLVKLQDGCKVRLHQDYLKSQLATHDQEVPVEESQNVQSQEDMSDDVHIEIPCSETPLAFTPRISNHADTGSDLPLNTSSNDTDVVSPSVVNKSIARTYQSANSKLNASPSSYVDHAVDHGNSQTVSQTKP